MYDVGTLIEDHERRTDTHRDIAYAPNFGDDTLTWFRRSRAAGRTGIPLTGLRAGLVAQGDGQNADEDWADVGGEPQAEYPTLDYKQACDLRDPEGRAEFVKDAAAMMSNPAGGYLVVGVDGSGERVGAVLDARNFDSARLNDLLTKHLEGEVPAVSQLHRAEAGDVVVIYLGRRSDKLFPSVKADMTYTDANGK